MRNWRESNTHVYFWGSCLSNFYEVSINYDNKLFKSSEQLFMYLKAIYFKDFNTAAEILLAETPGKAKLLGRSVKKFNELEWIKEREKAMFTACYNKFYQISILREILLETGNKTLVESSPYDVIWGIGLKNDTDLILDENNWRGLNLLGKILLQVREKIKKEIIN
jgi:ribA/ribD-fused uncharacterized protein